MPHRPTHIQCHCALIHEPADLLATTTLPVPASTYATCMCHCNMCRQSSGSLGTWYTPLKQRPSDASMRNLAVYNATPNVSRYFCKNCGCHVFICDEVSGRWIAAAGVVEVEWDDHGGAEAKDGHVGQRTGKHSSRNMSRLQYHEWLDDVAGDGGLATYLTTLDDAREVPSYRTEPSQSRETIDLSDLRELSQRRNAEPSTATSLSARGDYMQVKCHCGGVELRITPPSFPDTTTTSTTGHDHDQTPDTAINTWYIPRDRTRYLAGLCACRSCRLTLGFALQPWTYIPPSAVLTADGSEQVRFGKAAAAADDDNHSPQIAKLQHYHSSERVVRSFCSGCGASVFFWDEDRPEVVDVSVGVVRSRLANGLVGEWLAWARKEVSSREEAGEDELVEAWLRRG